MGESWRIGPASKGRGYCLKQGEVPQPLRAIDLIALIVFDCVLIDLIDCLLGWLVGWLIDFIALVASVVLIKLFELTDFA